MVELGTDAGGGGAVVERLARVGVVDDDAFAVAFSDRLRRRGHGHLRARADLERHGFEDDAAVAVAQAHARGDADAARAMVGSRFGAPPYDEATIGGPPGCSHAGGSTRTPSARCSACRTDAGDAVALPRYPWFTIEPEPSFRSS